MKYSGNNGERVVFGSFRFIPTVERANVNRVVRQLGEKCCSLTGEKRIMLVRKGKRALLAKYNTLSVSPFLRRISTVYIFYHRSFNFNLSLVCIYNFFEKRR